MAKRQRSRPERWRGAVSDAQVALSRLQDALSELRSVQEEYEEWRDGLPDNLQSGSLAEKLEAVCGLSIEGAADELESMLNEAEGADLPLGFGRD